MTTVITEVPEGLTIEQLLALRNGKAVQLPILFEKRADQPAK